MTRFLLLLALPLLSAPATAQESVVVPSATPAPQPLDAPPPTPEEALLILGEVEARMTVPVSIGGSGPYRFIIDTGAERSVVSRELGVALALKPGRPVNLTSMTGQSRVDTLLVPALSIDSIGEPHRIEAPALNARHLGAAGLLGIDTLRGRKVSIDFEAQTMAVRAAERRPPPRSDPDEIVIRARSRFGQLIVTEAFYNGVRIQVVLDTGSQVTMGNSALLRHIGARKLAIQPIELTSVTGDRATASYALVPGIRIGGVRFDGMPVAFADVAPFARFGLTRRPALLLGMDALRSFRKVEIDFHNREVRFLMPRATRGRRPI